jgi:geranylgeranyl pyrophosphate synthase
MDDLDDWNTSKMSGQVSDLKWLAKSLPATYAYEVLPEEKANELRNRLDRGINTDESMRDAFQLITASGAELYLSTEIGKHYSLAQQALVEAAPDPATQRSLISLLDSLHPDKST